MIIDDTDIQIKSNKGKPSSRKKLQQPPSYQVVAHQSGHNRKFLTCAGCVLVQVFQKSVREAVTHTENLAQNGKEPVLMSTKEIAEEKAAQANAVKSGSSISCLWKLRFIKFSAEPAP